jgi:hypothetical protein
MKNLASFVRSHAQRPIVNAVIFLKIFTGFKFRKFHSENDQLNRAYPALDADLQAMMSVAHRGENTADHRFRP